VRGIPSALPIRYTTRGANAAPTPWAPTKDRLQIELADPHVLRGVLGHRDENVRVIAQELAVDIHVRGSRVSIDGDPLDAAIAGQVIQQLYDLALGGYSVSGSDVLRATEILRESPDSRLADVFLDTIVSGTGSRAIAPKTLVQKHYVETIRNNNIVFGIGPAGTGKTYLAMAAAVSALLQRKVKRIVLTRPAVEAGERLGFLPGDLAEKVSPYLRPLYDALHDMLGFDKTGQLLERGVVEIAPLAFMRGRTLNSSFVILDEAQNATREQMKMFLTRLGYDSAAVITGDMTQIDLEQKGRSGLEHAVRLLDGVDGIGVVRFSKVDVVRHPLVKRIIAAYEADEADQAEENWDGDRQERRSGP
jgi:phosphate starvation-inducible PhoH-like protein